jgi:hypothetical protein
MHAAHRGGDLRLLEAPERRALVERPDAAAELPPDSLVDRGAVQSSAAPFVMSACSMEGRSFVEPAAVCMRWSVLNSLSFFCQFCVTVH